MLRYDVLTKEELDCVARWAQARKRELLASEENTAQAIARFEGEVKVLPAYHTAVYWRRTKSGEKAVAKVAPSRGTLRNELQAKKARALPMNAYNGIAT
jgi:hypothetical protein